MYDALILAIQHNEEAAVKMLLADSRILGGFEDENEGWKGIRYVAERHAFRVKTQIHHNIFHNIFPQSNFTPRGPTLCSKGWVGDVVAIRILGCVMLAAGEEIEVQPGQFHDDIAFALDRVVGQTGRLGGVEWVELVYLAFESRWSMIENLEMDALLEEGIRIDGLIT